MRAGLRRCLVCRCLNHRQLLFQIQYRANELNWVRSPSARGGSLYVCQNRECVQKLETRRLLQKCWPGLSASAVSALTVTLAETLCPTEN